MAKKAPYSNEADYVVVGAGSAGCVVAVRGAAVKLVPVRVRGFDQPSDARAHRLGFAPTSAFA